MSPEKRLPGALLKSYANAVRKYARKTFHGATSFAPVRMDRIVFSSLGGRGYCDSPKYLYEHIRERYPAFECVWALSEPGIVIPGSPIKVLRGSPTHIWYLRTSGYWISSARTPGGVRKRSQTRHLQTWHGTPLKKLGHDIEHAAFSDSGYRTALSAQTQTWDFLLSANPHSTKVFQSAFGFPESRIWEEGYPRNDILCKTAPPGFLESLRRKLNIPPDHKVVLYAPTWRDDRKIGQEHYAFQLELDLPKLKAAGGDKCTILARMHYHSLDQLRSQLVESEFVRDVSNYPDIQELYLLSDILITDYSSTMFDYALLRRPVLLYIRDIEGYSRTRGFYFDIASIPPGPIATSQADLERALKAALEDPLAIVQEYKGFARTFCCRDDGKAAERVARRFLEAATISGS